MAVDTHILLAVLHSPSNDDLQGGHNCLMMMVLLSCLQDDCRQRVLPISSCQYGATVAHLWTNSIDRHGKRTVQISSNAVMQ